MAWLMNINIVTVTSDLIFKRFAFQPVLKSKRIIPFNPTTISNPQKHYQKPWAALLSVLPNIALLSAYR